MGSCFDGLMFLGPGLGLMSPDMSRRMMTSMFRVFGECFIGLLFLVFLCLVEEVEFFGRVSRDNRERKMFELVELVGLGLGLLVWYAIWVTMSRVKIRVVRVGPGLGSMSPPKSSSSASHAGGMRDRPPQKTGMRVSPERGEG